ncbi:MAG: asparagine synthase (glutamine-hydrolyzing) [Sphingomicrobium sp.]
MCGIAGIVGARTSAPLVKRMIDQIEHRGPDGEGLWSTSLDADRSVHLGHRRLAILDLSEAGAQPMLDQSGDLALTYNGEIYNYIEIRDELRFAGVVFRSDSDSEVIIEAYRKWGTDCLQRFNGMFAFALFDRRRNTLFCARDRFGEKPFLFARKPGFFAFASEYKALLQHPGLSLDYNPRRLVNAALNPGTGLDADRQTLFDDVEQLVPGEALELDLFTLDARIWAYWDVTVTARDSRSEQAIFDEFRELLIDSVRIRMRSDVTVGSCLSGGLDSSAIVCIARMLLGDDAEYHSFTGRFPGTAADEWNYASLAVDKARTVSHVVEPTVDGFLADLPRFMWFNELPVGSSSQFAQWCVFRLAKEHGVTVLLDGQGSDEMLGGYEQYFAEYVAALQEVGDHDRLRSELPLIRARYPLALRQPTRALRDRLPFGLRHRLSSFAGIGTNMTYGLPLALAKATYSEVERPEGNAGFNALSSALMQDSFGRNLTSLLRYGDRNSMAHSREVRLPFCDHRLAQFIANLPPHLLMGEVQTKRLLRESMRGILPESIRTRWNKQGFRPPQDLWFTSPALLTLVEDSFHDPSFTTDPSWNADWWLKALKRVRRGELELGWTLWQPLVIEQWKQHFLEPLRRARVDTLCAAA